VGDRSVEQAGERTQAEERNAPERHHPSTLLFCDAELESRRCRRVRRQVPEAAHEEQGEPEPKPRADGEGGNAAAEQEQRGGHPAPRARDAARENESGRHRPGTEGTDDEARPGVGLAIGVCVSGRKGVHRVGGEADDRDDRQERCQLGPLPHEPKAVADARLRPARSGLCARVNDDERRDEDAVRSRVDGKGGRDSQVVDGQRSARRPERARQVERHRVQCNRRRHVVPAHQ